MFKNRYLKLRNEKDFFKDLLEKNLKYDFKQEFYINFILSKVRK